MKFCLTNCFSSSTANEQTSEVSIEKFMDSQFDLTLKILKKNELVHDSIFSPISIFFGLSTTFFGAKNETAQQIKNFLAKDASDEEIHAYFSNVWSNLKNAKDISVFPILKLFISKEFDYLKTFKEKVGKIYQGSLEKIDFDHPEAAIRKINDFISNATEGNIVDLIKENIFDDRSHLNVINTLYFDGNWMNQFFPENTEIEKFHVNKKKTINVEMMNQHCFFQHQFFNGFRVLKLKFENANYAMFFVLPDKRFGLSEVLQKLDKNTLKKIFETNEKSFFLIDIPKFRIEEECDFTEFLKEKGIVDLFDLEKSDLSQICTEKNIKLNIIKQKNFILVNEEGVKAGSVTYQDLRGWGFPKPIPPFIADHPFCYFIVENSESDEFNILFAGTVVKPTAADFNAHKIVTKSEIDLALEFFKRDLTKNLTISPIALFSNLASIGLGIDGKIEKKIFEFLTKTDATPAEIRTFLRRDLKPPERGYDDSGKVDVLFRIFVDESVKVNDDFAEVVNRFHPETLKQMDFSKNLDSELANFFKDNQENENSGGTDGNDSLKLILTSTVFPNLSWNSNYSGIYDFFVDENTKKPVKMNNFSCSDYGAEKDFHFFEHSLGYQAYVLYILVPKEKFGLKKILENVDPNVLVRMMEHYDGSKSSKIRMPEFTVRSTPDIDGFLKDAGLGELFDDENTAFTDNDGGNLIVSKIIQKIEIKLTKNGIGKDGSEEEPTPEEGEIITIDQPFAYFLVRKPDFHFWAKTNIENFQVVFAGTVVDPSSSN